tara:strand:- start:1743 stop:2756 length:1014 start_codon:yes stop_codon:yes gene_type:complete
VVKLKNKYVIGTHVMWFEIEMYKDFVEGLLNLLETVENKDAVIVDLCFNTSQKLEQVSDEVNIQELRDKFFEGVRKITKLGFEVNHEVRGILTNSREFYFHADYRRDLNYNYCKKVDYVMWGETDSFFPREAFQVIETLSEYTTQQNIHRYLLSFADRKMWDSSWDPLVHVDYQSHVFVDDDKGYLNPNQAKSPMSIEKMNEINAKANEFDFTYIQKPKISGACLVLSSDLIKAGVNVPPCLLYNDDEGLSFMSERVLGNTFIQFICRNVLHVHARRHPQKRMYVKGEDNPHSFISEKNSNFQKLLDLSKKNIRTLFTGQGKFYEYNDLKNILEIKQ